MKKLPLSVPIFLLFALGCGTSRETSLPEIVSAGKPEQSQTAARVREAVLNHFIEGSSLDAQGKYAEAILEYQEVVRLDPENAAAYYALSKDFDELNKQSRAAEYGREAVKRDPKNITYREHLAQVYTNAFQRDLAIREYEAILEIDSMQNRSLYNMARLIQSQHPLRALELYERLMEREGESWDLLLQSAEIYSTLGKYDYAIDRYESMLRADPGNEALRRQLAETYSKAGRTDDALALLESMHEERPDDVDVAIVLAEMYLVQGETDNSLNLYRRILSAQDLHPEVRMRIGVALFSQAEKDSSFTPVARRVFEDLREVQPTDWRPYWYLGAIALNAKESDGAASLFAKVTQLEPRNGDAWWYLGSIYLEQGKNEQLFEAMYRARQTLPNDFRIPLLLGVAHSRVGESKEAAEELSKAYKMNSTDVNVISSLALVLDGMERFTESDSLYEEGLRIEPGNSLMLNNYSYSLSERGLQLERALGMATKAVEDEPENPSYLDTIGWIHYMLGDYHKAQEYIEKAIASGEASSVVTEHLGDVYEKLGRHDDAITEWQKAFEKDPSRASLRQKLGIPAE